MMLDCDTSHDMCQQVFIATHQYHHILLNQMCVQTVSIVDYYDLVYMRVVELWLKGISPSREQPSLAFRDITQESHNWTNNQTIASHKSLKNFKLMYKQVHKAKLPPIMLHSLKYFDDTWPNFKYWLCLIIWRSCLKNCHWMLLKSCKMHLILRFATII
jgi:hypothetical protein